MGPVEVVGAQPDGGQAHTEEAQAAGVDRGGEEEAQPVIGDAARVAGRDGA
ncbi:hypothetical protein ABZX75_29980 [Streptomyces sp. NPDC003038]|uniref:hypothetical protein n=1 Tax=unclassified Streptomyces TaxID=2593676 RepID=UPI0033BC1B19